MPSRPEPSMAGSGMMPQQAACAGMMKACRSFVALHMYL